MYISLSRLQNISTQAGTGDLSPISVPICTGSFGTYSISLGVGPEGEIDRNIYWCVFAANVGLMTGRLTLITIVQPSYPLENVPIYIVSISGPSLTRR
jgi:hypothetical protein